jgi:hypothetical protein
VEPKVIHKCRSRKVAAFAFDEMYGLNASVDHVSQPQGLRRNSDMKKSIEICAVMLGAVLMCGPAFAMTQQTDSGAKQDMKAAGHESKAAAKDAAHGAKQGTKKAYHKTKRGTKKAYHKTKSTVKGAAEGAKEGAKQPQ